MAPILLPRSGEVAGRFVTFYAARSALQGGIQRCALFDYYATRDKDDRCPPIRGLADGAFVSGACVMAHRPRLMAFESDASLRRLKFKTGDF